VTTVNVLLAITHAVLAAAWVGGMAYSLFVVQPKLKRYFGADEEAREAQTTVIASGNRWKVVGLIAAIALTGLALLLLESEHWRIHAVKGVLLLGASGIFWYVSWRHWPRRVFATTAEQSVLRRQLVVLAGTMLGLTGTAFALGVAAGHL
jgi:Flp pilus assembly protein TadB